MNSRELSEVVYDFVYCDRDSPRGIAGFAEINIRGPDNQQVAFAPSTA
jgi:hypothetical protein